MDSYWDLYVAYVNKCVKENYTNDIDPEHYDMEWNHWLPKACFPDLPLGQYLTLKQHAIASALQTLGLKKKCMCGWHKKYLPKNLLELAWPLFCLKGELHPSFGTTHTEIWKKEQSERMSGEKHPLFGVPRTEAQKKTQSEKMSNRKQSLEQIENKTGELNSNYGKQWWVNEEGKTYLGFKPPELDWQLGRKFKQTEVKNDQNHAS